MLLIFIEKLFPLSILRNYTAGLSGGFDEGGVDDGAEGPFFLPNRNAIKITATTITIIQRIIFMFYKLINNNF